MELIHVVSSLVIIFTFCNFTTGLQICIRIWKKKSTQDFAAFPFIAGFLCTFLGLRYGLVIHDSVTIFVNSIGLAVFTFYVLFYYHFTLNKRSINLKIGVLIVVVLLFELAIGHQENPRTLSGIIASISGVVFSGSPMTSISQVVRDKNAGILPFWLILSTAVVALLWFAYGFLIGDAFIQISNSLAVLLAVFQLSLFVFYPPQSKYKDFEKQLLMENL
ncbi:sugar transporter SWEET1 [Tetranychus urticae]|uniref:Sugar transporter SWEET1 n=1 Tax=Tetranychus urticae TaxID=32264 RepID=T1KZV9_TETUR|nr:sugar transporter SWEET1 [Tetranychus urticae]